MFVVTRIITIPIGTTGAYINVGDVSIYLIAYLLGGPLAAISAAVGSAVSDLSLGYAVYAPATFIIKGLMALEVGFLVKGTRFWIYVAACVLGGEIMTVGYACLQ